MEVVQYPPHTGLFGHIVDDWMFLGEVIGTTVFTFVPHDIELALSFVWKVLMLKNKLNKNKVIEFIHLDFYPSEFRKQHSDCTLSGRFIFLTHLQCGCMCC